MHRLSLGTHALHLKLLEMGEMVELSLSRAVEALTKRDWQLCERVIADEQRIDSLELEIDDMATRLLALHQPVARDLRLITATLKINSDLERIGDLATNVARRCISLMAAPEIASVVSDLRKMAGLTISMLSRSLSAFLNADADIAREVLEADDEVDFLRDKINGDLLAVMQTEPSKISTGIDLLLVSRSLERIADHATNIAEDVVYLVRGIDVRHRRSNVA
jgi:phosphate transport system protein